jgi:hypothetical protein
MSSYEVVEERKKYLEERVKQLEIWVWEYNVWKDHTYEEVIQWRKEASDIFKELGVPFPYVWGRSLVGRQVL